jgi:hypothetical protein
MDSVKTQPDVVGVLLGMVGGLAVLYPIIPGLAINYDKLLAKPLPFLLMLLAASGIGKATRRFTDTAARCAGIVGIVATWYVVYGTLFSHSLRF